MPANMPPSLSYSRDRTLGIMGSFGGHIWWEVRVHGLACLTRRLAVVETVAFLLLCSPLHSTRFGPVVFRCTAETVFLLLLCAVGAEGWGREGKGCMA